MKRPVKQIRGFGQFVERLVGAKDDLWAQYGSETVFESRDEYDSFVGGRSNVTFIRFKDMEEFEKPIDFDYVHRTTGMKRMPRGGKYLGRETVVSIIEEEL